MRSSAGVELLQLYPEEVVGKSKYVKDQWKRMMIGFAPSPYFVTTYILVVEMMTKGSYLDIFNVFRWLVVKLNLSGMESYNPTLPWVFKFKKDSLITADVFIYIDDGRPLTITTWECWKTARKFCCILNGLG